MSKLHKFFFQPNQFWRDYFLKKAPLNFDAPTAKSVPVKSAAQRGSSNPDSIDLEDLYAVTFPIDIVYTWVDANDEQFIISKQQYEGSLSKAQMQKSEVNDMARFNSLNELKYSLRSIEAYAPWVNHIYIVTNGQIPAWLNLNASKKVTVVSHAEILDAQYLPTFNSHVIESALHRIPGLSEHYLYLNDDVMFTRPIEPSYFFTGSGLAKVFITNSQLPPTPQNQYDTPTQWASKNCRDLLFQLNKFYAQTMFAHTFHPQRKSVHEIMECKWPEAYHQCRQNRFRNNTDINTATFLHHHFSLWAGYAIVARTHCMYFNIRHPTAVNSYKALLAKKNQKNAPFSVCLNDLKSTASSQLANYAQELRNFLNAYYPHRTIYERIQIDEVELNRLCEERKFDELYQKTQRVMSEQQKDISDEYYIYHYYGIANLNQYKVTGKDAFLLEAEQAFYNALRINSR